MKPALKITTYIPPNLPPSKLLKITPQTFSLLSWNIYKKNHKRIMRSYFDHLILMHPVEYLLLQESYFLSNTYHSTSKYEQHHYANLNFKHKAFGLLNASRILSLQSKYEVTRYKEFLLNTRKAFLANLYPSFIKNETLMLINIHAINFRSTLIYQKELERLRFFIHEYKGPLIIAGDFNTWNRARLLLLYKVMRTLSLKAVHFHKYKNLIKCFRGYPLDHIFYRGLTVKSAQVLNCEKISDHNPLYVSFSFMNSL